MLYSKERNPSSYWMESLNKSIRMAIRLTFALPQFLSKKKKIKDVGKVMEKKRIRELDGTSRKTKNYLPFLFFQTT